MWLDLSHKDDNYNEYLVVHEFGHALGLGHEHQRSDFRACIISFLDETKMSKKLQGRYKDWSTDVKLDINRATEYDPESVMHYWLVDLIYACQALYIGLQHCDILLASSPFPSLSSLLVIIIHHFSACNTKAGRGKGLGIT